VKALTTLAARVRKVPLRRQLMIAFATLSISSTVIATLSVASFASHRLHRDLREKSVQYARQLQRQLEPVIEYDDHVTAQEAFDSMLNDADVDGLGVYAQDGRLLEGRGERPALLPSISAPIGADGQHVVAVGDIQLRDGRKGHVFVRLNSRSIDDAVRRNDWLAAAIAGVVALCALALGATISRLIARRLERIGDAVKLMAAGEGKRVALHDAAEDSIGDLALAFNTMVRELDRLSAEHERLVTTERERLELLVSERTLALERSREMFRLIAESTLAIPFTLDLARGAFLYIGAQASTNFNIPDERWACPGVLDLALPRDSHQELRLMLDACESGPFEFLANIHYPGRVAEIRWTGTCEKTGDSTILRGLMQDVTEVRQLARELTAAQKLESVGRLAAGVAHEINTPVQFVSDNVEFLTSSMQGIASVISAYRALKEAVETSGDAQVAAQSAGEAESQEDIGYILENVPPALSGAREGLKRIAAIVHSMKSFAHPDQGERSDADLNQAIESTLVIARNEYKYVAEVETDLQELPRVRCYLGEINQVILNLLVNAAHAIGDAVRHSDAKGKITIRSCVIGHEVEISIADTGDGIPVAAREKIFDPFFTTKEVGRGTGQGLAIARSVIVNKHGGSMRFETEIGKGTTFFIRLPIGAAHQSAHLAA